MSFYFSKTMIKSKNTSASIAHEKENIQDKKALDRRSLITNRYADLFKFVERKHTHSNPRQVQKRKNKTPNSTLKKLDEEKILKIRKDLVQYKTNF